MIKVSLLLCACVSFLVSSWSACASVSPAAGDGGEKEMVEIVYYAEDGSECGRMKGDSADERAEVEGKPFAKKVETKRFFGEDGKPVAIEDGYSIERKIFEKKKDGETVWATSFFDVNDKPCMALQSGFSMMRAETKPGGSVVSFYDEVGKPCVPKVLFRVARMEMDWEKGKELMGFDKYFGTITNHNFELRAFGVDGKPMLDPNGVARTLGRMQPDGSQITLYYGVNGEPKQFMNRFEKVVAWYGKDGNVSEVQAQTVDGKLKDVRFGDYWFSTVKTGGDTVRLYNAAGEEVKNFTVEEFRHAWEEFLASDDDTDYREEPAE